jgi:predicted nucleic acid-binding protein
MSSKKIYLETSVISYLTAKPRRDVVQTARMQASLALWEARGWMSLHVSEVVLDEISSGDPAAALRRRALVDGLPVLSLNQETQYLAQLLVDRKALPKVALTDALHIALATVHKMDAIASYNFRHIAGAFARQKIEHCLMQLGYRSPVIASPDQLLEV